MRVLFVDDDRHLLASMRRQLMFKLPGCDLSFCSSVPEALQECERQTPDLVVSDVRMPGLDGPALLERIARAYPDSIRFALTGQSTAQQLDRTYAVAHQVFTKPYPAQQLGEIIAVASAFRRQLEDSWLRPQLTRSDNGCMNLRRVSEVIQLLDDPDTTVEQLRERIEGDQAARTRLLGIANSAFFSPRKPVTTVAGAVVMLGFTMVKAVYLACQMIAQAVPNSAMAHEMHSSFERGIATGIHLKRVTASWQLDDRTRDLAMLAAVFHRFGRVQFSTFGGREYQLVKGRAIDPQHLLQLETEMFGASQASVGAYVLYVWGLPAEVCRAIDDQDLASSGENSLIHRALYEAKQRFESETDDKYPNPLTPH